MPGTDDDLRALYPFLHGGRKDPVLSRAALLESVQRKADDSVDVKRRFFADNADAVVDIAEALAGVYRDGGRLFAMGNGGSACDAAHVVVEFLHPVTAGRPALGAVNLTADAAMMTAVGNDIGFEHVFVRQLVALAGANDALVGFSTSGNSQNMVAAFTKARALGLVTIALSGGDGGMVARADCVDFCLVVPTHSIHRVQETHVAVYHIVWDLVHTLLADTRGRVK